jgi:predicted ATP-grasp superfamily ATP-dependent carboligase
LGRPDAHVVPEASATLISPDQLADRHAGKPLYRRRRTTKSRAALDALILEGDTRGSVAVARSLGRSGYSLAVAAGSMSTRHASERAQLTDPRTDFEAFKADLIAWLGVHPVRAVLTSGDAGVSVLSQIRGVLEPRTRVGIPPPAATALATSKERTLALAAQLGIPIPRSLRVVDADSTIAAARELGYPCVLKPSHSWQRNTGAGGQLVRAAFLEGDAIALEAAEKLVSPECPALVQEYAPGRREAISLFSDSGRVHARFAMVATRSWPPLGGNSVMRVSIAPPRDTLAHAEKLVSAAGLDGYSEVEFRRAGDGRPLLMEVNPRFSQSVELAIRSGVDFPRMQLAWILGERPPAAPERYREGVRLSWLGGEVWGLASAAFKLHDPHPAPIEALRSLARDYRRPPNVDGLAWDDPLPILRATAAMSREVARGAYTHLAGGRAPGRSRRRRPR